MTNILVLTAIERSFYSATIEYQLIDPLLKISSKRKGIRFIFLTLVPVSFYFVRGNMRGSFALFHKRRKRLRKGLGQKNFTIFFIPVLFPIKHKSFYLRIFEVPFFLLANLPILLFFQSIFHPLLIQARGYPAAFLAYLNKRFNKALFLFDMRDVYTKKGIEAGVFRKDDISIKLWNLLEKQMVSEADGIIVTSQPFKDYVVNILQNDRKIWTIPNSVNRKRFFPDEEIRRRMRKELAIENRFVLVHSGTFSTKADIGLAIRYFRKWKQIKEESLFLILMPNKKKVKGIIKIFVEEKINRADYKIINPEPEEVSNLLKVGDVGLHLESSSLATEYCIAIKDGEYLATGLPIICTPYLKGIVPLIEEYNVGIVTDPDRDLGITKEEYLLDNFEEMKNNTKRIIKDALSLDLAVQTLNKCYERFLSR